MNKSVLGFSVLAILVGVSGCKQNPMSEVTGQLSPEKVVPSPVPPAYVVDGPDSLQCVEGNTCEFALHVSVPEPGTPILEFQGLPEGAVFMPGVNKVLWTPTYQAANDPSDDKVTMRTYNVGVQLKSSVDALTIVNRKLLFIAVDNPQPVDVSFGAAPWAVQEGQTLRTSFSVASSDYPHGPFAVSAAAPFPGLTVTPDQNNPTQFKVELNPGFNVVDEDHLPAQNLAVEFTVRGPGGRTVTVKQPVSVRDVRQDPAVSMPSHLTQGSEVSFSVQAEDLNEEKIPVVKLAQPAPFGRVRIDEALVQGNGQFVGNYSVMWDQIPAEQMGQKGTLSLAICVNGLTYSRPHCVNRTVDVSFEGTVHAAPRIDRSRWILGQKYFMRAEDSFTTDLPIYREDPQSKKTVVEILPENLRQFISWKYDDLNLKFSQTGVFQFNVKATSEFGVSTTESFVVEVLPKNWSNVLMLADSTKDPEVKAYQAVFPGLQIAIPSLGIDERMLALRDVAFVTTSALSDPNAQADIGNAITRVKNVIVASPLVGQLSGALADEMKSDGVVIRGRLNQVVPGAPDVASFLLMPDGASGLPNPTVPFGLKGTFTSESKYPALFDLGAAPSCKTLLRLLKPGQPSLDVAGMCNRKDGGKLIFTGFEWADGVVDPADYSKLKQWLDEVLK